MSDIERQEQVEQVSEPVAQAEEAAQVQEVAAAPESTPEDDFMASVDKTLVQLRPGQTVTGTVLQITDDEVCVNVGYKADGLIKKADLSSTDVKVGDEIEVEVVKVNDGEGNVLLSQRNVVNKKNWDEIVAKYEAGEFVRAVERAQDTPVAVLEEIAWENGWVGADALLAAAEAYGKSAYGAHLRRVAEGKIVRHRGEY